MIGEYFSPRIQSSSSIGSAAEEPADPKAAEEIEEAPAQCLHDEYALPGSPGNPAEVVERMKEALCCSLGGDIPKSPTCSPQPLPQVETAELTIDSLALHDGKPLTLEMVGQVRNRLAFLELLGSSCVVILGQAK